MTSTNLTIIVMERARWTSSPGLEILTSANEFLIAATGTEMSSYALTRTLRTGGKVKKEEYPTLARLARKYLCVS